MEEGRAGAQISDEEILIRVVLIFGGFIGVSAGIALFLTSPPLGHHCGQSGCRVPTWNLLDLAWLLFSSLELVLTAGMLTMGVGMPFMYKNFPRVSAGLLWGPGLLVFVVLMFFSLQSLWISGGSQGLRALVDDPFLAYPLAFLSGMLLCLAYFGNRIGQRYRVKPEGEW